MITNSIGAKLTLIPAGTFQMGSPDGDGAPHEHPRHRVRISRPFYLGVHEVTQRHYQAVMGHNPSGFSSSGGGRRRVAGQSTDNHPVENVSWLDAVAFCNKLSEKEGREPFYVIEGETVRVLDWTGPGYRLPTEAEWEYACRANTTTRYSFGDNEASLGEHGWYGGNSGSRTHPVGRKHPNAFGLFDMHGNVWEWCWDGYDEGYYNQSPLDDPQGPSGASGRVLRGAAFGGGPRICRSACRFWNPPENRDNNWGFRLALGQSGR
jgi:formylglycine-generating enzyme required for sulfatase activity